MKTSRLFSAAIGLLALSACSNNEIAEMQEQKAAVPTITVTLPSADTRTVWAVDGTGATPDLKGKWEATDALSVTWTQDGGSSGEATKFVIDKISADGKTATFKQATDLGAGDKVFTFTGKAQVGVYYPYIEKAVGDVFPYYQLQVNLNSYGASTLGKYTFLGAANLQGEDGEITSEINLQPISSFMRIPSGRSLVKTETAYNLSSTYVALSQVNNRIVYRPTSIDTDSDTGLSNTEADLSSIVEYDGESQTYVTMADLFIPFFPNTDEKTPSIRLFYTDIEWVLSKQTYESGKLYTISETTMPVINRLK